MTDDLNAFLEPGQLVKHPSQPDWGTGQVQSNINGRVTVNFPEVGKRVFDSRNTMLDPVYRTTT